MYEYIKIDNKVDLIIEKASSYMSSFNKEYIKQEVSKAYLYARDAHEGVMRDSGEPYIDHPVEATLILLHLKPDLYTIQSCLLHDVIEDTPITKEDIKDNFGAEVAFLCAGMEKLEKVRYIGEDRNIGSLRKMFVAMAEDLRVIFIKLSDRLHNMKTLKSIKKKYKRERIALETLNIYAPIADRLGLHFLKNSLEEECFKILEPEDYKKVKKEFLELKRSSRSFLSNAENEINSLISGQIFNCEIDLRVKSIYSMYKKMKRKGLESISSLYDVFGIRITVNDVADCYKTLGLIHNIWTPIPKKFKDYVALPKPNGYQSLHTTVIGLLKSHREQPTEIQIKTYSMREYSDIGVAAHFGYKEKGSKISKDINWVKELKEITESLENNDFISSLKIDVFKDRIFIFTPKGKSINLPVGSTPIDFAYYVHTDLGDHISIAKVNSKIHPLDKELCNGDVVEIITDKSKKPNLFWVSFVKTSKAKNRIKGYLKKGDKDLYRERGKEIMNKYLVKSGVEALDKDLSFLKVLDGKENNMEERLSILEQIGNFSRTPSSLFKAIVKSKNLKPILNKTILKEIEKELPKENIVNLKGKIIIGGEDDMPYKLGSCISKLSGQVVGHINSNGIITIHKRDCKILNSVNRDRLLSAYFEGTEKEFILIKTYFLVFNEIGILKEICEIISSMSINIDEITSKKSGDTMKLGITVEILDYDYLVIDRLIERIKLSLGKKLISYSMD